MIKLSQLLVILSSQLIIRVAPAGSNKGTPGQSRSQNI